MRIRSKLLANTFVIIVCLATVGGIGFYYTHSVAQAFLFMFKVEAIPIIKINKLEEFTWNKWLNLTLHSGTSDLETMQKLEIKISNSNKKIAKSIQEIEKIYTLNDVKNLNSEHIKSLQEFKQNWQIFQQVAEQILLLSKDFTKEDALNLITQEGQVSYEKAINNLGELINQHSNNMEILRENALQARQDSALMISLFTFIIGFIAVIFINRFTHKFIKTLLLINKNLKLLASGNPLTDNIDYKTKDEIGEIVLSSNQLKENITNTIQQANTIAKGNYNTKIQLRSDEDQLGQALLKMTNTLSKVTNYNEIQNWLKTGQTQLHDQMSGNLSVIDLAHNIISFLTLYVEGQVGICYLVEQTSDEGINQSFILKQVASYAYTRRKNLGDEFGFSEGLVERAAKAQEIVIISIDSGLGEEMPKHIIIMPFLYENIIKGVIVLGTQHILTEVQRTFLDQVMQGIGIAVNTVESRAKMQDLLKRTQIQAHELVEQKEKLQHQTEELTYQKEELQNQAEELQSQTEELQTQQEELRQSNEQLEARTGELEQQQSEISDKNTALKQSQTAIQEKAQELELASKYKSEFLANMSHELRTPLNSLLILSQLLEENKDKNLNTKQVEYAKTIHGAGTDLLGLIDEILDLSKVEAGKIEVQMEEMFISDTVRTIEQNFNHVAKNKGVDFKINIAIDIPEFIQTDRQRFMQIINNLLSNAFKFTKQGEVKLNIENITDKTALEKYLILEPDHNLLKQDKLIIISVSDTGIGIPKAKQQLIFEAFQQADGTTSRCYGGTGLGLSISRQLARLLGGELLLQSEAEKGSTFTLYLPSLTDTSTSSTINSSIPSFSPDLVVPVKNEVVKPEIDDDREDLQTGNKSILIIEDDINFSNIFKQLARDRGFKCLVAEDGLTGLELAEEYTPSAIVLDISLPHLDGLTVMERLKDNPKIRHIPVHFISATDKILDARKMGAIGYLLKPVDVEKLNNAFNTIEYFIDEKIKNLLVIVDDNVHQNKILEIVKNKELQIKVVITIDEAMEKIENTHYDCVILDIDLENKSGCELLQQIRKEKSIYQTPLIIYTERNLSSEEEVLLLRCGEQIPIKQVKSPERLLDETTLFLHQVEAELPENQRNMLRMVHDKTALLSYKKVLLVDDDVRNSFALTIVLEDHDMEVIVAVNGKQGLEKLEKNDDVDIILMDIMMPEMDGHETMEIIRKQPKYHNLPIIALTAKAMKGDRLKCIESGANDYLSKPIDSDKLLSLMRVWLYR